MYYTWIPCRRTPDVSFYFHQTQYPVCAPERKNTEYYHITYGLSSTQGGAKAQGGEENSGQRRSAWRGKHSSREFYRGVPTEEACGPSLNQSQQPTKTWVELATVQKKQKREIQQQKSPSCWGVPTSYHLLINLIKKYTLFKKGAQLVSSLEGRPPQTLVGM
jgi:hypothetical protein